MASENLLLVGKRKRERFLMDKTRRLSRPKSSLR